MNMKTLVAAFVLVSLFPFATLAAVTLGGKAPEFEEPGLATKIDQTWQYEKAKYLPGRQVADPEVDFFVFDRASESQAYVDWQNIWIRANPYIWLEWSKYSDVKVPNPVTNDWVDRNISKYFPFPKLFRAIHYDDTNRIQVDPNQAFLSFYVNDPYGNMADHTGYGYYSVAHELLHYALEQRGIPIVLHHCLFVTPRDGGKQPIIEDAVQFLLDQNIASFYAMYMGAQKEKELNPCDQLTAEQRAQVKSLIRLLP